MSVRGSLTTQLYKILGNGKKSQYEAPLERERERERERNK